MRRPRSPKVAPIYAHEEDHVTGESPRAIGIGLMPSPHVLLHTGMPPTSKMPSRLSREPLIPTALALLKANAIDDALDLILDQPSQPQLALALPSTEAADHELQGLIAELEQRLTQAGVHDWPLRQRLLGSLVVLQARWARARWLLEADHLPLSHEQDTSDAGRGCLLATHTPSLL